MGKSIKFLLIRSHPRTRKISWMKTRKTFNTYLTTTTTINIFNNNNILYLYISIFAQFCSPLNNNNKRSKTVKCNQKHPAFVLSSIHNITYIIISHRRSTNFKMINVDVCVCVRKMICLFLMWNFIIKVLFKMLNELSAIL